MKPFESIDLCRQTLRSLIEQGATLTLVRVDFVPLPTESAHDIMRRSLQRLLSVVERNIARVDTAAVSDARKVVCIGSLKSSGARHAPASTRRAGDTLGPVARLLAVALQPPEGPPLSDLMCKAHLTDRRGDTIVSVRAVSLDGLGTEELLGLIEAPLEYVAEAEVFTAM